MNPKIEHVTLSDVESGEVLLCDENGRVILNGNGALVTAARNDFDKNTLEKIQ